ncbi:pyridoxamine 5'-phosphate oxidase family protein [Anoxybacterium hadale]|uniref:Pyridoxamine 5'-phosphate oxidase family protein n=1 Tax=Anoxybacterium hadale TaxID=3408580 RepID=A0ACD1A8C2_9FIRM|nr:pyridoxamine 5'-phosphate oxidase family protein [Clostridiales bacterium]
MFRKMRLESNQTTEEEVIEMLNGATNGVLAVQGDEGYPYTVPLSFAYQDGKIYFHSTAETSHKIESISKNPKVSFCVVTQDQILPEAFNTLYRSVVLFGKARVLTEPADIARGIRPIVSKYSGEFMKEAGAYMKAEAGKFCVVEIEIEHMTGKAGS